MKTQINQLVKGDHRTEIVGTSVSTRSAISLKVREENPIMLSIELRGVKIDLVANWSISKKSVDYSCEIPLDLYRSYNGEFGLPKESPKAYLHILTDCTAILTTNSKKKAWTNISTSEIFIN